MKTSDKICPLTKEQCMREKCVCFSVRDTDTLGVGFSVEPYGVCSALNINLDYEDKAVKV